MTHATRREVPRPAPPAPPGAKPLHRTVPSAPSAIRPERGTTWRPPRRESGTEEAARPYRPRADSGICAGEEVVADLSKDPRHDDE